MKEFKAHCSSLGTLMQLTSLTDKQLEKIAEYSIKPKLTEKQSQELKELTHRRDNPELLVGAKTMLREWYAYQIGKDKDRIFSKETQKGIVMENTTIELLDDIVFGSQGLVKNIEFSSNDFIQGTPDVIGDDFILDAKSPWDSKTFYNKLTEPVDTDYIWQIKGYCVLKNKSRGILGYGLVNTPTYAYLQASYHNRPFDEIVFESTYEHIPESERVIGYKIPILESDEKEIEVAIKRCRDYLVWYDSLVKKKLGTVNNLP
jgi:hypothetical protein